MKQKKLKIAIDANEANTLNRVGSNVYAFEVIKSIYNISKNKPHLEFIILLSSDPVSDLPQTNTNWRYKVIKPSFLWTQFAEPIYLFLNRNKIDVLFTPGHYAPRVSSIPYISSVMDLAFLDYSKQFNQSDLIQLKHWTKSSVSHAKKVVTISEFTKKDIVNKYQKKPEEITVAYPAISKITPASAREVRRFFKRYQIRKPYFLFLGTIQPRKNIVQMINSYEQLCRLLSSQQIKKGKHKILPQLVLAGRIGWKAEPIIDRIQKSPFKENIITLGFIPESIKPALYERATASLLIGLHEGFGIPPLESMQYGCIPIVSNTTSLPEVVGEAGYQVDPTNTKKIVETMEKVLKITQKNKLSLQRKAKKQLRKFSWQKSAQVILETIQQVTNESS